MRLKIQPALIWIFFFTVIISCSIAVATEEDTVHSVNVTTTVTVINPNNQDIELKTTARIVSENSITTESETTSTESSASSYEKVTTGQEHPSAQLFIINIPRIILNFPKFPFFMITAAVLFFMLYKKKA